METRRNFLKKAGLIGLVSLPISKNFPSGNESYILLRSVNKFVVKNERR